MEATVSLLNMARELSWNDISGNCRYIISEIKEYQVNFFEERKIRIAENNKKNPVPLVDMMPVLMDLYSNLYDINLYVYNAKKELTIIDIRYYQKSSLEPDYGKTVQEDAPMLHCKVEMPPYYDEKKIKFDINWVHNSLNHRWKMFWWRRKGFSSF